MEFVDELTPNGFYSQETRIVGGGNSAEAENQYPQGMGERRVSTSIPLNVPVTEMLSPQSTFSANCHDVPTRHQSSPSERPQMEELFAQMAQSFVRAVRDGRHEYRPRSPNVEFHGLPHESPEAFLRGIEEYFTRCRVVLDSDKLHLITGQLKGDAHRWFDQYRTFVSSYEVFKERFRGRFDSLDSITQCITKLYGETQAQFETASVFITKKVCLFNRADPFKSESMRSNIILDQLRPEIRSRLRGQNVTTSEALLEMATRVEKDIVDESMHGNIHVPSGPSILRPCNIQQDSNVSNVHSSWRPPANNNFPSRRPENRDRNVRFENEPPRNITNSRSTNPFVTGNVNNNHINRPNTPCRYCEGTQWHYHADCPNNPYRRSENYPGARQLTGTSSGTS